MGNDPVGDHEEEENDIKKKSYRCPNWKCRRR